MRMVINDYEVNDIMRIMREWSNLRQQDVAESLNRSRDGIIKIEKGYRNTYLKTFLEMANKNGIKVIMEKDEKGGKSL